MTATPEQKKATRDSREPEIQAAIDASFEIATPLFDELLQLVFDSLDECIAPLYWSAWADTSFVPDGYRDPDSECVVDCWNLQVYEASTIIVEDMTKDYGDEEEEGNSGYLGFLGSLDALANAIKGDDGGLPNIYICTKPGMGPPHISFSGHYKGLHVCVEILTHPPENAKVGMYMDRKGRMWYPEDEEEEGEELLDCGAAEQLKTEYLEYEEKANANSGSISGSSK